MTADQVAVAIVSAARRLGADPLAVAQGHRAMSTKDLSIPRARAYAATALVDGLGVGPIVAGRVCGSQTPEVYLSVHRRRLALGEIKWWKAEVLAGVIEDIRIGRPAPAVAQESVSEQARPITAIKPRAPVARLSGGSGGYSSLATPPPSRAKQSLQDMLREAVENTAKLKP